MSPPRLIVCERTAVWTAAVRNLLPPDVPLRQVRSLEECLAEVELAPHSLLAIELTPRNIASVLALLDWLARRYRHARAIVFADHALAAYEALMREAGAIHFVCSPRELVGFKRTLHNHLARAPRGRDDYASKLWDALPWTSNAMA